MAWHRKIYSRTCLLYQTYWIFSGVLLLMFLPNQWAQSKLSWENMWCSTRRAGLSLKGPERLSASLWALLCSVYISRMQKKGKRQQRKQHLLRQTMSNCVDPDNVSYLLYRHCPSRWVMLTDFSFHGPPCREWKSNLIHIGLLSNYWVQLLWPGLKVLGEQDNKFFLHKAFSSA